MEKIKSKIQELLEISKKEDKGWDELSAKMQQQETLMNELKDRARERKTLLGRIIKFQHADSYAYYIIIRVNVHNVIITWINYCDAWVDDRCGYEARIDINYASEVIRKEDALARMFAEKRIA